MSMWTMRRVKAFASGVDVATLASGASWKPSSSAGVLLVADLLHPLDDLAVEPLLDRDVGHGRGRSRAVPVLLAGREPDHVTGSDLLDRASPPLRHAAARHDDQRLPQRMGVPGGSSARLERDAGARGARRVRGLEERVDAHGAGEIRLRPLAGRLRTTPLDVHGLCVLPRWASVRRAGRAGFELSPVVDRGAFPFLEELNVVLALVQSREAGHLSPDRLQAIADLRIDGLTSGIEGFPRDSNARLAGNHPRVQGAADGAQVAQRLGRTHPTSGDADESDHLAFELVRAGEIQRVLQHAADAAVNLGRAEDDPIRGAKVRAEASHGVRTAVLLFPAEEWKMVAGEIEQLDLRSFFLGAAQDAMDGQARRAPGAKTAGQPDDSNLDGLVLRRLHAPLPVRAVALARDREPVANRRRDTRSAQVDGLNEPLTRHGRRP